MQETYGLIQILEYSLLIITMVIVTSGLKFQQVLKEIQVLQVLQVLRVLLVQQELKVRQVLQDLLVTLVH
tara:strand:- start:159 stop:368 length:210 start_codon:yes stop_codon:yes gene_type:complete